MRQKFMRAAACLLACLLLWGAAPAASCAAGTGFTDVPADHWAAASITHAVQLGLVQGRTATTFGLGRAMTRSAFAVVLCRTFGWELISPDTGSFQDNQDPRAWYYSAVETALAHGAVTLQSDRFRPGDTITREEIAVMLVRALGYTALAGLDQGMACPFRDVTVNSGYLTMACCLGIAAGTSPTTFAPDQGATREQAVVMLMRVYDRLHQAAPQVEGAAQSASGLTALSGYSAAAVSGAVLKNGKMTGLPAAGDADFICAGARTAGAKALLYVTGEEAALSTPAAESAAAVAAAAVGYDGVLLDFPRLSADAEDRYTALTSALNAVLGPKELEVVAEAPTWQWTSYDGYNYAALAEQADVLILRIPFCKKESGGFPMSPTEPLEQVYYALAGLKGSLDFSKLSLWLTTTGTCWWENTNTGSMDAREIERLLQLSETDSYYSERYGSAFLTRFSGSARQVVWYNSGRSAAEKMQMCALFGVSRIFLSSLNSVAEYEDYSLLEKKA